MKNKTLATQNVVLYALFIAMTVVMTMIIRIPIPFAQGYVNIGDSILLLAAMLFGPAGGFWIGGMGSALADLFTGYSFYAPITFVVKGIEGLLCGWIFLRMNASKPIVSALIAGIWMAIGYVLGDWILFGLAAGIAAFPMNLMQGIVGAILAVLLHKFIGPIFLKRLH